ncbi:MAG: OFA family MFS transporter [Planctomycetota bacterium]|nr:OFA family MFS transporter [Planctomycetota bacterium]
MMDHVAPALPEKNRGWTVTFAGLGINLALGILYSWSVIGKQIPKEWKWDETDKSWPYMVACLIFSLMMVPAGRMQDRLGPRLVAGIGGLLVGAGMILASFTTTPLGYILGFGVLAGTGIGFGYASATPPAVKWFPKAKTGLIAGLVVSGFGLSGVYAAPLTKWLIETQGLPHTIMFLGIGFLTVVLILSQLLVAPPPGYVPSVPAGTAVPPASGRREDYAPTQILGTWQFYLLWFMYFCGAGAGLMYISKAATIALEQADIKLGFILVAILAIGNGAGRILAGILSDKIGRKATMALCFTLQAILLSTLSLVTPGSFLARPVVMGVLSALIGANYGANLALFPSVMKDFYGLKNFGVNYGLVFTAWGAGGFALPLLAGMVHDGTIQPHWRGSFVFAYYCAVGLLVVAALVTFILKPPRHPEDAPARA